jgi:NitT/TauT family transport system substrate-binding protein
VLTARGEGLPLVALWTQNQEDGYQLVCKKKHGINQWTDLRGKKVGAWFGGPEYSVWYAMKLAGLKRDDAKLLPQKALSEFFQDKIDCASAMAWNEVHTILDEGNKPEDLTFLKLSDLGKSLPGDSGVTTEKMIAEHPDQVQAFVTASLRGWQYALEHPEEAAEMTLKYAPDLDKAAQVVQVEEVAKLMAAGPAAQSKKLGTQSAESWANVETSLREADQLKGDESVDKAFDNSFLDKVPAEYVSMAKLPAPK